MPRIHIEPEHYLIPNDLDITNSSYIYGETYPPDIIKCITKTIPDIHDCESFIDIGSGVGKLVCEMSRTFPQLLCHGIEIHKDRYETSIYNLNKDEAYNTEVCNIDFENICFGKIYFGNYDIIYCCNTVFSKEDNKLLYSKILNECSGYVLLYNYNDSLKRYLIATFSINTSWQKDVELYVFYI